MCGPSIFVIPRPIEPQALVHAKSQNERARRGVVKGHFLRIYRSFNSIAWKVFGESFLEQAALVLADLGYDKEVRDCWDDRDFLFGL